MAAPSLTSRHRSAAKRRLATSSVASVASGYERSPEWVNADAYRFSCPASTICSVGDR